LSRHSQFGLIASAIARFARKKMGGGLFFGLCPKNIRLIQKKDLPQLLNFSKRTFAEAFAHLNNPEDFEKHMNTFFTYERLEKEFDTEGVLFYIMTQEFAFADNPETIMGFLKLNIHSYPDSKPVFYADFNIKKEELFEIERIYVDTPYHGQGIAQQLMAKAEAVATENNCPHVWLGVWNENKKALRFYEKMGYKAFGEHVFTVGTDDQIDILMIKNVASALAEPV
jgi:diamine N-acetyltransferase